ncbi:MAG: Dyp-type peroxidase [Myxococcota bacterium]
MTDQNQPVTFLDGGGLDISSQHAQDLSGERGEQRLLDRYRLMQRGLVYPAPYARFVSYWTAEGKSITRADITAVMKQVRDEIHERFGSTNTSAIVGVNFDLYRQWCEDDGGSIPAGMKLAFPEDGSERSSVFDRSRGVFQDSEASLWFHIKSDEQANLEGVNEVVSKALGDLVGRSVYQDCNQRLRPGSGDAGRVLGKRFAENLNNPTDPVTIAHHTLVGHDDIEHLGASYALAQRFYINWERIHQMAEEQVEDIIGRNSNDEFLPNRDTRSHIKSARQQDAQGNTTFVMRLGLPFGASPYASRPDLALAGNNRGDEAGIYFAGFAKRVDVFETIMSAQIGDTPGFMNDRLFNNLRSDLGGFFYIPNRRDLGLVPEPWAKESERDWTRFPGIDWSRLSRHFTDKSPNGWMYYNHKNYLYEMATMPTERRAQLNPPSTRILTLLMDMFARWQDAWYFAKGQDDMGSLYDHIASDPDFGPEKAKEVHGLSIMERKGWATRMQCRLYATDAYGYRGRRKVDGVDRPGADTYRIHPEEIIVGALPDLSLGQGRYCMKYLREEERQPAFFRGLTEASGVGHVLPDHQKLVDLGLGRLLAEIDAKAESVADDDKPFYRACRLSLEGVQDHLERYAALADSMAAACAHGQAAERNNLEQIAARCRALRTDQPSSMVEAAQLIFTYHTCLHLNGEPVSVGRLDQYLGRFHDADIEAGRLTPEGAQEIIDALWVKLSEKILQNRIFIHDHQPYGNLAMGGGSGPYPQGASLGQWIMQVTVGGWVADEEKVPTPAYNEVTRLCIRASGRLPLTAPCLSLRVNAHTPADLLEEAARAVLSGGAHPILLHDDKIAAGLAQSGDGIGEGDPNNPTASTPVAAKAQGRWDSQVSIASARNFASDGCYEPLFTGQTWFALGGFSTLNPLECALNQGRSYASAGETFLHGQNLSFHTPPAEQIESFEQLLELYFTHFRLLWAKTFDGQISTFDALADICPAPLLSVLTDDCLAKGQDIYGGGARYNVYAPCWIGLSTTINSLWNIKRMVFDEDSMVTSLAELLECLMCDWGNKMVEPMVSSLIGPNRIAAKAVRFQRLREIALSMPRYGEGNPEVDELGDRIVHEVARLTVDVLRNPAESTAKKMLDFANRHGTPEQPFGGFQIHPGTGTFENFSAFGVGSGASADGRRLNAPIASDMSAAPARSDAPADPAYVPFDAALASSEGDGASAMWDGAPTDFNIDETFPVQTLADMFGQFARGKGSNILTVTVASRETFTEAPSHPESYDLLRVRMGGWSEYFTSMFPVSQVQHQRRPVMTPPHDAADTKEG